MSKLVYRVIIATDEFTVNNNCRTLLAADWDVSGSTRPVSMAIYNVRYGPLCNAFEVITTSAEVAAVCINQEHVEIIKINEHPDLSVHAQALQKISHIEAHRGL